MVSIFSALSDIIWGWPTILLLLGTGIYFTIVLRGIQFRGLLYSLKLAFIERKEKNGGEGEITHFQALMTALAATVGTGNIAGVATAITLGGPGALFWMWITGIFGMATKYAEAVLAVKYRETDSAGEINGGPMYYIQNGLGLKWLGVLFAVFTSIAAFGIGNMVQSNSVAAAALATFNLPVVITGIVLTLGTALVILGGIRKIAAVTSVFVPVMIILYMSAALIIIALNLPLIPGLFKTIIVHAFTPTAASGGFAGAMVIHTMRWGVARGIFSNESGLGSSPIAAAAAKTSNPVRQALVSMTQTFIDTIIVCTMTGLVILISGAWTGQNTGAELTAHAFSFGLPGSWGDFVVSISLIFFAYSTLLGWSYYGEKSIEFLFGIQSVLPYRIIFCIFIFIGAIVKLDLVWAAADVFNGLMALPNLAALLLLAKVIRDETNRDFLKIENK